MVSITAQCAGWDMISMDSQTH